MMQLSTQEQHEAFFTSTKFIGVARVACPPKF